MTVRERRVSALEEGSATDMHSLDSGTKDGDWSCSDSVMDHAGAWLAGRVERGGRGRGRGEEGGGGEGKEGEFLWWM